MKSKLANRSDRQRQHGGKRSGGGRTQIHNGQSLQRDAKFLNLTPHEIKAQIKANRKFAIDEAARLGLGLVRWHVAELLKAAGVPIQTPRAPGVRMTSYPEGSMHLVPKSIADFIKHWEEAQNFAGPAGHVAEFRSLQLKTVVELAVVEWQEQQKGQS